MLLMVVCLPVTFAFVDVRQDAGAVSQLTMAGSGAPDHELLTAGGSPSAFASPADLATPPMFTSDTKIEPDNRSLYTVPSQSAETTESTLSQALARLIWAAPYVTAVYFLGVVLMMVRLSTALWGGHKLRRASSPVDDDSLLMMVQRQACRIGLKIAPAVAFCEQISIPVVVGVVKPMILLPAALASGLSPDQLQLLVTHELAHIRRYDLFVNLLQRLSEAVLFFHPAVWFVSRRVSIERENAADDLVLAAGWQPAHYADALVRMAELSSTLRNSRIANQATALAASGTNTSDFKRRVLRLLENTDSPTLRLTRGGILAMMLVATSLLVTPVIVQSWTKRALGADEWTNKSQALQATMNTVTKSPVMLTATVRVTNQRGEPIVGAVVRPLGLRTKQYPTSYFGWQSDQWGPAPLSRTDTKGLAHVAYPKYMSDTVETGQVTWLVDHGDYAVFLGDRATDDGPAQVVLEDGITIEVRAIDDRTNQSIDAPFALLGGNPVGDRWRLENDGTLVSRCVARERRSLRVMHLPRKETEAVLFSDLIDLQEYRGNTLSLTVHLKPGVHVTGSLGGEVPRPVKDGRVIGMVIDYPEGIADPSEYASRWEWQEATQVGADGSFDLGWLPAGETLQILALCDGFVSRTPNAQELADSLGRDEGQGTEGLGLPSGRGRESARLPGAMMAYDDDRTWPLVVVLEGHSADVNLRMEPTTACRVKLVGPDDRPVAGAKVMFSPNQAWHRGGSQVLGDGDSQSLLLRKEVEPICREGLRSRRTATRRRTALRGDFRCEWRRHCPKSSQPQFRDILCSPPDAATSLVGGKPFAPIRYGRFGFR